VAYRDDEVKRAIERHEALRAHYRFMAWVTGGCAVLMIVAFLVPPLTVACTLTAVVVATTAVVLSLRWRRP